MGLEGPAVSTRLMVWGRLTAACNVVLPHRALKVLEALPDSRVARVHVDQLDPEDNRASKDLLEKE